MVQKENAANEYLSSVQILNFLCKVTDLTRIEIIAGIVRLLNFLVVRYSFMDALAFTRNEFHH